MVPNFYLQVAFTRKSLTQELGGRAKERPPFISESIGQQKVRSSLTRCTKRENVKERKVKKNGELSSSSGDL